MAPNRTQPASQTPSQAKKQATISSFFTPKPTQAVKSINPGNNGGIDDDDLYARNSPTREIQSEYNPRNTGVVTHLGKRRSDSSLSDVENEAPGSKRRKIETEEVKSAVFERTKPKTVAKPVSQPAESPARSSQIAASTSRYAFSSSQPAPEDQVEDDEAARRYKERMHELFVKKLVRPDAFAELRRRNNPNAIDQDEDDPDAEDAEEEEEPDTKKAGKKKPGGARANGKLTPMETQYLDIKRQNMDTIIIYQVGYKYRVFGEDARIAAKELSFFLIPGKFRYDNDPSEAQWDRLASCSFPVVSLNTHVKRLVAAGHKVGVVRQLETAALKAVGNNRNTPFVRKLTNVYTKGTYVDDVEGADVAAVESGSGAVNTGFLLCLTESNARGYGNDEKVHIGVVAVQPATGSIIYDDFEDGFMRSELETRLLHIAPCEYLVVGELSDATEKLIKHLAGSRTNVFGDQARLERTDKSKTAAAEAYSHISSFYSSKIESTSSPDQNAKQSTLLDKIHQLTEHVTIALSAMIKHLIEYGLEHVFDLTKNFQSFSARTHMLINGNTLSSLEIYRNQTDHTEKGSLFWSLDRTKTRFGRRLLRSWVGRPLLDKTALEERSDAVQNLVDGQSRLNVDRLRSVIDKVKSDLEKVLTRIYYKKAARPEVLFFLQALQKIANDFSHVKSAKDGGFQSSYLNSLIAALPPVSDIAVEFLDKINAHAAKTDDKYGFFRSEHETDDITNHTVSIAAIEHDLEQHKVEAAKKLGKKKVEYVTVLLTEYLIEVPNEKAQLQKVPASWIKVNGTKKMSRFHTPEVVKMIKERDQHKEAMAAACDDAYTSYLEDISARYQELRECIQALASIDCLLSLATVAAQPGYVKPTYVESPQVVIRGGRHPMVEQLLLDAYVPNDIRLQPPSEEATSVDSTKDPSALLITGPNMGGKSSYVRSVALIAIMAQIGSYVPAESAELGMLDAVFTRMGAFDNMMRGESTFMVELGETSDILKQATPRSLVILDELGRGTSTHDGVAIAEAVLKEMVSRGIMTMFITHYQDLAKLGNQLEGLQNVHMKFQEDEVDSEKDITFLYEVGEGVAHRSYGLNVAKLARLPKSLLDVAVVKSKELEQNIEGRKIRNLFGMINRMSSTDAEQTLDRLVAGVEQLA